MSQDFCVPNRYLMVPFKSKKEVSGRNTGLYTLVMVISSRARGWVG